MKVGNIEPNSSTILGCIECGETSNLSLIAHRRIESKKGELCGFIVVCQQCFDKVQGQEIELKRTPNSPKIEKHGDWK